MNLCRQLRFRLRTNTYLHSVEEWHEVPDRLAAQPTLLRIRTPDGTLIDRPQYRHHGSRGDVSRSYDKIEPEILRCGIAREGRMGDARSVLCEARSMADLVGTHLQRDPHYFASR